MTKEQAMEYLKKAAEVVKIEVDLGNVEDEGRQLFCTGMDMYEIHMYSNNSFIDMAKALEKPFTIDPDWSENNGYCKFYTPIDGFGEREWEIFTLFDKEKGWPNAK